MKFTVLPKTEDFDGALLISIVHKVPRKSSHEPLDKYTSDDGAVIELKKSNGSIQRRVVDLVYKDGRCDTVDEKAKTLTQWSKREDWIGQTVLWVRFKEGIPD